MAPINALFPELLPADCTGTNELKRGGGYVELGDQIVVRILGPEVGLGVTDFFVVSVGRFAAVDAGLVVIVVDSLAGDVVGVEVTLCPRLCYKKGNYFLSLRPGALPLSFN